MEKTTYMEPTTLWRLSRGEQVARAVIVPHALTSTLLWFIDEELQEAVDSTDLTALTHTAEGIRQVLQATGWQPH